LDEVEAFVKEHPNRVTERGGEPEGLAIHYAVGELMTYSVDTFGKVAFLLTANPQGATEKDKSGRLPLHLLATQSTLRPEMLRLLLNSFPGATNISDLYFNSPLHLALRCRNHGAAMILLREHVGELDGLNKQQTHG
jgi:ankyrin repeat protein